MELTGIVLEVRATQQVTATFSKRELIVEIDGDTDYPQPIPIEAVQDKVSMFDGLVRGQTVTVKYNLRGNYWEGGDRYFVSLQAWRVEAQELPQSAQGPAAPPAPNQPATPSGDFTAAPADDIPF